MRIRLFCLLLFIVINSPVNAGTITVAQDGSRDVNSVQAAVATVDNGDEIVILDSAVYEEDLIAGAAAEFASQFTLKAAEGQTPVIRALNASSRLEPYGVPSTDLLGAIFFGCVGVLIEGITFENQTTDVNANTISSAIALLDCNNVTLRNCTIRGAGGPGTGYAAFNFGILVYGLSLAPTGILLEDCVVEECHFGVQFLKAEAGAPTDPSVTLRRCVIQNCNGNGIEMDCASTPEPVDPNRQAIGEGHLIEDTQIINCQNPATLGGGKIVFRNCDLLGNRGYMNIDKQDTGELPVLAELDNVAIIGSENMGIRVIDGIVNMTRCIIAGCANEGLYVRENADEALVTVDHCDFYQNLVNTPESFEIRLDPATVLDRIINVSNTNVIGVAGIINGNPDAPDFYDDDAVTASYCNVQAEFETYLNVTVDHDVSLDPMYVNPSADPETFTREGFQLQEDSPIATAGSDGGYIGSQGLVPVGILHWMMY